MSNDDGRKGRNLSHNFYYKIYHTVNRLRSFLSSSHSGHSGHFGHWGHLGHLGNSGHSVHSGHSGNSVIILTYDLDG